MKCLICKIAELEGSHCAYCELKRISDQRSEAFERAQHRAEKAEAELAKANDLIELTNVCKLTGSSTWEDLNGAFAVGELKQKLAKRENEVAIEIANLKAQLESCGNEHQILADAASELLNAADEAGIEISEESLYIPDMIKLLTEHFRRMAK